MKKKPWLFLAMLMVLALPVKADAPGYTLVYFGAPW